MRLGQKMVTIDIFAIRFLIRLSHYQEHISNPFTIKNRCFFCLDQIPSFSISRQESLKKNNLWCYGKSIRPQPPESAPFQFEKEALASVVNDQV